MIKTIIFDFDGVITESVGVKADGFAMLYEPYGKNVVNQVLAHHYANGGVSRYEKFRHYHKAFLGSNLNKNDLKELGSRFSEFVVRRIIKAPYVKGALKFIMENYNKINFFISTGTPQNEIEIILKERGISHYFIEIYGSPQSKIDHITKIINKHNLNKKEIIFIGDSITDKNAANQTGIPFVARIKDNKDVLLNEHRKIEDFSDLRQIFSGMT